MPSSLLTTIREDPKDGSRFGWLQPGSLLHRRKASLFQQNTLGPPIKTSQEDRVSGQNCQDEPKRRYSAEWFAGRAGNNFWKFQKSSAKNVTFKINKVPFAD